jgi:septum formation protein
MPNSMILASASPRRVELLRSLAVQFEVIPSSAEELHDPTIPVSRLCELNASIKAAEVSKRFPERWVLGADTLVTLEGKLFGKPRDTVNAQEMLLQLQGRVHEVITGVSLQLGVARMEFRFHVTTRVRFKQLDIIKIHEYMQKAHVLDKAGAYGIQEHGDLIVESIEGSYSNVVGLPLEALSPKLQDIGILAKT